MVMIKQRNKKIRHRCLLIVVIVICTAFVFTAMSLVSCFKSTLEEKILNYCETNSEITLSEVTSFDWDIAYFDYQSYMHGEEMKEKYGLSGEFETLSTDHSYRIAFYKDNKFLKEEILSRAYIEFDRSVEIIEPDTLFTAEWISRSYNDRVLSLQLTNDE